MCQSGSFCRAGRLGGRIFTPSSILDGLKGPAPTPGTGIRNTWVTVAVPGQQATTAMRAAQMLTRYPDQSPFRTKDGSEIRELMHPAVHGNRNQSLAEARVDPGAETRPHRHLRSEEIYHITAGTGLMHLDGEQFAVGPADSIAIPPGSVHWIRNSGQTQLVILCCCSPPYSHEDTELA